MLVQLRDRPFGGIATAQEIAPDGRIVRRAKPLAVRFPGPCIGAAKPGTLWSVEGKTTTRSFVRNGFHIEQEMLQANSVTPHRISGKLLARWIAKNVTGIGEVIAHRLVRALPELDRHVREHDLKALCTVAGLSEDRAHALIEAWPSEGLYEVLGWLRSVDLPLGIGERICRVYGESALEILQRDPFSLLGFGVRFRDALAVVGSLGIGIEDDRVLIGLAEHAVSQVTARTGSTVVGKDRLVQQMRRLSPRLSVNLAGKAPEIARNAGVLVGVPDGYQAVGHAIMERAIAGVLKRAAGRRPGESSLLANWEVHTSETTIAKALSISESQLPFSLTGEQRSVVTQALRCPVAVISGEAGTGKTTILRAILGVYDQLARIPVYQVALSGRAARRMTEATGRPASTIAKFIAEHLGDHKPDLPEHLLLVVDEASMVDILSAYRMVGILPDAARLLFVGDVAQLPPVGPGLVFHALMDAGLPVFRLSQVKRQRADSGIHRFAQALRRGHVPEMVALRGDLDTATDVVYTPEIRPEAIKRIWLQAGGAERAVILSPTRKGSGGVDEINAYLQRAIGSDRPVVRYLDDAKGWIPWIGSQGCPFHLNDRIMVTVNDYTADVRNGDLGTIVEVFESPGEDDSGGLLEIDGRLIPLTADLLAVLSLGYAVTIHKSQGSQWPVCIVMLPPQAEKMAARALFYTAATRATEKLYLCGNYGLLSRAVRKHATSPGRWSNLTHLLKCEEEESPHGRQSSSARRN